MCERERELRLSLPTHLLNCNDCNDEAILPRARSLHLAVQLLFESLLQRACDKGQDIGMEERASAEWFYISLAFFSLFMSTPLLSMPRLLEQTHLCSTGWSLRNTAQGSI